MRRCQHPTVTRRRRPSSADISICNTIGHRWRVASGRLRDNFREIIIDTGPWHSAVSATERAVAKWKNAGVHTSSYGGRDVRFASSV